MLLWFVGFAFLAYWLFKGKGHHFTGSNETEELLKKRYINGEIDEETYFKMKRTINR